jgi:hypothetical protein
MSTTALPVALSTDRVAPGSSLKIRYNWQATEPLAKDYSVFVHFVNDAGETIAKDDHTPSVVTGSPGWNGTVGYERRVVIPAPLDDCTCRILLGLRRFVDDATGWERLPLEAGTGTEDAGDMRYHVGFLTFDKNAPKPKVDTDKAPSLNLDGFEVTFSEDFDGELDVSPWGPGTRWIAHTPWDGDFGDAAFADPVEGFPFTIEKGILRIEARKDDSLKDKWNRKWAAGLLSSNDPKGNGFSQQYGYFEMRAKLPAGAGVWPAFWLM